MQVWNIIDNILEGKPMNTWNVRLEHRPTDDHLLFRFKLLDDDGFVYYRGRATCEHAALDALDAYECTGVTTVEYWDDATSKWLKLN